MRLLLLLLCVLLPAIAEVGKITYIKGHVFFQRDNQIKPATVGMQLQLKDTITTKEKSMTKFLLSDKSAISLGSNSEFDIHDFLYDPSNKKATADLQSKQGIFRIVTGKISKISPERFKLKTKTLTIGIRGTIFSGEITKTREDIFCEKGKIVVSGAGLTQEVVQGFKTFSEQGSAPSKPKAYTSKDISKIREQTEAWKDKACEVNLDKL